MLASLFVMLVLAQSSAPQAAPENLLAKGALDAFTGKCVQCHGPDVPHPKGAFGYVTDLNRLVASKKYVIPGNLDKSMLWKEIDEGDMPPDEARAGPLTHAETEAILQWIVGGAPPLVMPETTMHEEAAPQLIAVPPSPPQPPPEKTPAPPSAPQRVPDTLSARFIALLGRFHVLAAHFPIALLLVAALTEGWDLLRRSHSAAPASRLCLNLGALAAIVAAGLGWIHALDGFAGPFSSPTSITGLHRWIGTTVGVLAPVMALVSERDARRGRRTLSVRMGIIALGLATGAAAHFGGLLTHGSGYFDP